MCGIAGFADSSTSNFRTPEADFSLVHTMCDVIRHRGPDDEGVHTEPGVGLGMRRLSIIDLSTGHQPMHNEDQTVWIVFNGEIYNYRELRRDLEAAGHRFYTSSDTETIVHAYEEWGEAAFARLRGMFGIGLWDRRTRTLAAGARSRRPEAAPLRDGGRPAVLRVRSEVADRRRRRVAGNRSRRARSLPVLPLRAARPRHLQGRAQAAAGALPHLP